MATGETDAASDDLPSCRSIQQLQILSWRRPSRVANCLNAQIFCEFCKSLFVGGSARGKGPSSRVAERCGSMPPRSAIWLSIRNRFATIPDRATVGDLSKCAWCDCWRTARASFRDEIRPKRAPAPSLAGWLGHISRAICHDHRAGDRYFDVERSAHA
jgi:hypothetical protein